MALVIDYKAASLALGLDLETVKDDEIATAAGAEIKTKRDITTIPISSKSHFCFRRASKHGKTQGSCKSCYCFTMMPVPLSDAFCSLAVKANKSLRIHLLHGAGQQSGIKSSAFLSALILCGYPLI